jgi:hypothetical protein
MPGLLCASSSACVVEAALSAMSNLTSFMLPKQFLNPRRPASARAVGAGSQRKAAADGRSRKRPGHGGTREPAHNQAPGGQNWNQCRTSLPITVVGRRRITAILEGVLRNDGKTELQHYVPKVLLRPHAHNPGCARDSEQIWCFDKLDGRVFSPNIRGIASGNGFYDIILGEEPFSLEPFFTGVEDRAAPAIQRIVSERSLAGLTDQDRQNLAVFCAVQLSGPKQHETNSRAQWTG